MLHLAVYNPHLERKLEKVLQRDGRRLLHHHHSAISDCQLEGHWPLRLCLSRRYDAGHVPILVRNAACGRITRRAPIRDRSGGSSDLSIACGSHGVNLKATFSIHCAICMSNR